PGAPGHRPDGPPVSFSAHWRRPAHIPPLLTPGQNYSGRPPIPAGSPGPFHPPPAHDCNPPAGTPGHRNCTGHQTRRDQWPLPSGRNSTRRYIVALARIDALRQRHWPPLSGCPPVVYAATDSHSAGNSRAAQPVASPELPVWAAAARPAPHWLCSISAPGAGSAESAWHSAVAPPDCCPATPLWRRLVPAAF